MPGVVFSGKVVLLLCGLSKHLSSAPVDLIRRVAGETLYCYHCLISLVWLFVDSLEAGQSCLPVRGLSVSRSHLTAGPQIVYTSRHEMV
jgi:hypothetical protein